MFSLDKVCECWVVYETHTKKRMIIFSMGFKEFECVGIH